MAASRGQMKCKLYPSAFSGEVVFQVNIQIGLYEGVVPKHCVMPSIQLPKEGANGQIKVRVLENDDSKVRVRVPDDQILVVSADKVHAIRKR